MLRRYDAAAAGPTSRSRQAQRAAEARRRRRNRLRPPLKRGITPEVVVAADRCFSVLGGASRWLLFLAG